MLKGKNALVTGSTSGIGLGYARALAEQGANVTINGFGDAAAIEKEGSSIEKDFGVKAAYSPADMTKPGEIAEMIHTAEKTYGSLDILVNNAGIQYVAPIRNSRPRSGIRSSRSICIGVSHDPRRRARHEGAQMGRHHQHGVRALAGRLAVKSAYVSAKQALPASPRRWRSRSRPSASRSIASVRVMSGLRWSEADSRHDESARHDRRTGQARCAVGRSADQEFVTVDEVAALALYLCSDAAKAITGANLSIDGGWTAE